MSYIVIARKWRPQDFDAITGQKHITSTLKNAIQNNKVAHAYIFSGPRGIGKTSTARILAKALNCENSKGPTIKPCNKCNNCLSISEGRNLDVIEIDGASNRGIDEVRQLRESVRFAPAQSRFKVYVIDEVHMLTTEAFNALLKTLEEPPPYVKFIFATTNADRVLPTILSRCQRFDFRRIPVVEIIEKLKEIAKAEKIKIEEDVFFYIAKASEGSLRDAESILDQLSSLSEKIDVASVNSVLGLIEEDVILRFVDSIIKKETAQALVIVDELIDRGKDIQLFLSGLIEHLRNMLIFKLAEKYFNKLVDLPEDLKQDLIKQAGDFNYDLLISCLKEFLDIQDKLKRSDSKRIILEVAIVKLTGNSVVKPVGFQKPESKANINQKEIKPTILKAPSSGKHFPDVINKLEEKIRNESEESSELKEDSTKAVSIAEVQDAWPRIVEDIKTKRMSIGTYLSEGSLINVEDNVIKVGFLREHNFHKEFLEKKDNRKILEDAFSNFLNTSVKILLNIVEVPAKTPKPIEETPKIDLEPAKPGAENFVQSVLDTFKGKLV